MSNVRAFVVLGVASVALVGGLGVVAWKRGAVPAAPEARPKASAHAAGNVASVSPRLPPEKPCLAAPTDAGEDEMVASAGLDPDAIRTVMRGAAQNTLRCFRDAPSLTLMLSINVGCNGRVAKVDVTDDGGASPDVQRCVQDVLRYASFPAHALPDGDTFDYPLVYNAPN